ncbi:glycosyltransferase [Actinomadura flavalba]|uniref:glycosyltransferase n=1 Tax=Actinomadura flavalba TaxID=1120938 RepID=UPI00036038D9|nr:glycosyltransferase family 4 protein [Actinomadura flavalba]
MNILIWHVHGSWTTAFVQGPHRYLVPTLPGRTPDGLGRARTWNWPDSVEEVAPADLRDRDIDLVIVQRPHEPKLVRDWAGRDLPMLCLEHNAPDGDVPDTRHPMADRPDVTIVHVTHFNDLMWDCGSTPTRVVEHGVLDPGPLYTGELPHTAVVTNEPLRRGRYVGADLLRGFAGAGPMDVFGMGVTGVPDHVGLPGVQAFEDLPQDEMHAELARRRVYLHPVRWTSLGLSLLEAMHLGMPVVALGTTEVAEAVPPGCGVVSTNVEVLREGLARLLNDPDEAAELGAAARRAAVARFSADRFLRDWEATLAEVAR